MGGKHIFKWASNSTYYWRSRRSSQQLQTSCRSPPRPRATPSGRAASPQRGAHLAHADSLLWAGRASMWLLSASERPASSLKHVNIKRGIICSECGHSLSRPTVDNRTCFHITVRGSRQMIKVGMGSIGKSNTSPTNGGISAGAGVFVIQVLFLSEHQDFFFLWGHLMGRWEQETELASPSLSLSVSLCFSLPPSLLLCL